MDLLKTMNMDCGQAVVRQVASENVLETAVARAQAQIDVGVEVFAEASPSSHAAHSALRSRSMDKPVDVDDTSVDWGSMSSQAEFGETTKAKENSSIEMDQSVGAPHYGLSAGGASFYCTNDNREYQWRSTRPQQNYWHWSSCPSSDGWARWDWNANWAWHDASNWQGENKSVWKNRADASELEGQVKAAAYELQSQMQSSSFRGPGSFSTAGQKEKRSRMCLEQRQATCTWNAKPAEMTREESDAIGRLLTVAFYALHQVRARVPMNTKGEPQRRVRCPAEFMKYGMFARAFEFVCQHRGRLQEHSMGGGRWRFVFLLI